MEKIWTNSSIAFTTVLIMGKNLPDHNKGNSRLGFINTLMLAVMAFCLLSTSIPSYIRAACQTYNCTCYGNQDFSWDLNIRMTTVLDTYTHTRAFLSESSLSSLAKTRKCRTKAWSVRRGVFLFLLCIEPE